jgi:DNA transformation protein
MPVSDRFVQFVVDQLEASGPITSRRMFGGVGIYASDVFFALLDDDTLYLKVDDSNRADFEAVGSGPFRPYGEGGEVMQYYEVPADVLEDATELCRWAAKAIAVARAKKAGKPRVRATKAGTSATRKPPAGRRTK